MKHVLRVGLAYQVAEIRALGGREINFVYV